MTTIETLAKAVVVGEYMSGHPEHLSRAEAYDDFWANGRGDGRYVVWTPFDGEQDDQVAHMMRGLYSSVKSAMIELTEEKNYD